MANEEFFEALFYNLEKHIQPDEQDEALLRSYFVCHTLKKKQPLLLAGNQCKAIYFVCSGCLRIYYLNAAGEEHNLMFCPENWWATDILSFTRHRPARYSIDALEDSVLLSITGPQLEELYSAMPKLERFFRILMQNGFGLYQDRVTSGLSQTAEQRYKQFTRRYPGLEGRISQKHIASYLGITPVFLSMLKRSL